MYRRNNEDDDQDFDSNSLGKPLPNTPPIHNEDIRGYYGFQQPLSFYGDDDDKRMSNGSILPDGMRSGKDCLRVTNPDDFAVNRGFDLLEEVGSTVNEDGAYSSGDEDWKK